MNFKISLVILLAGFAVSQAFPQSSKPSSVIECKVNEELDSKCEREDDSECRICVHQSFSKSCKPSSCDELIKCINDLDLDKCNAQVAEKKKDEVKEESDVNEEKEE